MQDRHAAAFVIHTGVRRSTGQGVQCRSRARPLKGENPPPVRRRILPRNPPRKSAHSRVESLPHQFPPRTRVLMCGSHTPDAQGLGGRLACILLSHQGNICVTHERACATFCNTAKSIKHLPRARAPCAQSARSPFGKATRASRRLEERSPVGSLRRRTDGACG